MKKLTLKTICFAFIALPALLLAAKQTLPDIDLISVAKTDKRAVVKVNGGDLALIKLGDKIDSGNWQLKQVMDDRILLLWKGDQQYSGNQVFIELVENRRSKVTLMSSKPSVVPAAAATVPVVSKASASSGAPLIAEQSPDFLPESAAEK